MIGLGKIIIQTCLLISMFSSTAVMNTDLYKENPENIPIIPGTTNTTVPGGINTSNIFGNPDVVDPNLRIQYIAVGDGECIYITGGGKTALIDGGENLYEDSFIEYLKEYRIEKIDYLILTSPIDQNTGVLDKVIDRINVSKVYLPEYKEYSKDLANFLNAIKDKGIEATKLKNLDQFNFGEGKFTVYKDTRNNSSAKANRLVLNLEYKNKNFLFTSDIDKEIEKQIYWQKADVLKVANKGRDESTDYLFLVKTNPKTAVIIEDSQGHSRDVVELIKKFTEDIYIANDKEIVQITYDGVNLKKEKVTNPLKKKINMDVTTNL